MSEADSAAGRCASHGCCLSSDTDLRDGGTLRDPRSGSGSGGGSGSGRTNTTPPARPPKPAHLMSNAKPTVLIVESICCHKEVPLVTDLLMATPGVYHVRIAIALRQASVWHSRESTAQQLADVLNASHLGAHVHRSHDGSDPGGGGSTTATPTKDYDDVDVGPRGCCGCSVNRAGLTVAVLLWLLSYVGQGNDLDPTTTTVFHSMALVSMVWTLPAVAHRALLLLRRGVIDINTLMVLAALGSVAIGDWSEGAAVLALFSIGERLESHATGSARQAVEAIVNLQPQEAVVLEADPETGKRIGRLTAVDDIPTGSVIALRPGDSVPVDCRVTSGTSTIDESSLTGEAVPVPKTVGDELSGGTVNAGTGYLEAETTAASEDSAVARLARLVQQAQAERSPTERAVERISRVYTPFVVFLAVVTAFLPASWQPTTARDQAVPMHGDDDDATLLDPWYWPRTALVLLVLACPCALVISTPIAYVCSLARAANSGILVRGGEHLETLAALSAFAIDKTGTLTAGSFRVRETVLLCTDDPGPDQVPHAAVPIRGKEVGKGAPQTKCDRLWSLIRAAEQGSSHPLALALSAQAQIVDAPLFAGRVTHVDTVPGLGIRATLLPQPTCTEAEAGVETEAEATQGLTASSSSNKKDSSVIVEIGSNVLAERQGWAARVQGKVPPVDDWELRGDTVVWVAVNSEPWAVLACSDQVRSEAADTVQQLHDLGVACVMLTGDNAGAAERVASQVGLDSFQANLLPEEKVAWVKGMCQPGAVLPIAGVGRPHTSGQSTCSHCCFVLCCCCRGNRVGRGVDSLSHYAALSSTKAIVVGMVGDGVNDAPALAASAVGVAMGVRGAAVAMETADVALMDSDLTKLALAVRLGRRCKRKILWNIALAVTIKVVFITLALLGAVTLPMATLTDVGGMLLVTFNSVSLLGGRSPQRRLCSALVSMLPCFWGGRTGRAPLSKQLSEPYEPLGTAHDHGGALAGLVEEGGAVSMAWTSTSKITCASQCCSPKTDAAKTTVGSLVTIDLHDDPAPSSSSSSSSSSSCCSSDNGDSQKATFSSSSCCSSDNGDSQKAATSSSSCCSSDHGDSQKAATSSSSCCSSGNGDSQKAAISSSSCCSSGNGDSQKAAISSSSCCSSGNGDSQKAAISSSSCCSSGNGDSQKAAISSSSCCSSGNGDSQKAAISSSSCCSSGNGDSQKAAISSSSCCSSGDGDSQKAAISSSSCCSSGDGDSQKAAISSSSCCSSGNGDSQKAAISSSSCCSSGDGDSQKAAISSSSCCSSGNGDSQKAAISSSSCCSSGDGDSQKAAISSSSCCSSGDGDSQKAAISSSSCCSSGDGDSQKAAISSSSCCSGSNSR